MFTRAPFKSSGEQNTPGFVHQVAPPSTKTGLLVREGAVLGGPSTESGHSVLEGAVLGGPSTETGLLVREGVVLGGPSTETGLLVREGVVLGGPSTESGHLVLGGVEALRVRQAQAREERGGRWNVGEFAYICVF